MDKAVQPPGASDTPFDSGAFRAALGRFATGITIITCWHDGQPMGITANSFASVSLDPPLVLWSPAKASRRHLAFSQATHFAIHILEAGQEALCHSFARPGDGFKNLEWQTGAQNVPLFAGCLARFECSLYAQHDAGDHTIIIGHVDRFEKNEGTPLVFSQGAYLKTHA